MATSCRMTSHVRALAGLAPSYLVIASKLQRSAVPLESVICGGEFDSRGHVIGKIEMYVINFLIQYAQRTWY